MNCNFNKVILMGRLTQDPELRELPSGTKAVRFPIAVNRKYTTNGEEREEAMFIDCNAYARKAEVIEQYFAKGRPIFIEGRLTLNRWEKKDGTKMQTHRVNVLNFEFLDNSSRSEEKEDVAEANAEDVEIEENYDALVDA
jgi:single-strand DNA-binding protein